MLGPPILEISKTSNKDFAKEIICERPAIKKIAA
jgi:hypothetical protein